MDYIYTSPSLDSSLCDLIISKFNENEHLKYEGSVKDGVVKSIKDTTDMLMPVEWNLYSILSDELEKHLRIYMIHLNSKPNFLQENNYEVEYQHLTLNLFSENSFMIQSYKRGHGKYIYHDDSWNEKNRYRVITFLWYLNDIDEGGETEFFGGSHRIKPEKGKLLLFPATWTFPHRGNMPISSNKYIITGWLYRKISSNREEKMLNPSPEIKDVELFYFKHFFGLNKKIFYNYKYDVFQKESFTLYTHSILEWISFLIRHYENSDLSELDEVLTFLASSFNIILAKVKLIYNIDPNFNIQNWYYIKTEDPKFGTIKCDLYIQVDLCTGIVYIENTYRFIPESISFFINFSFDYLTDLKEKKSFTIKELADPFLDLI